MNASRRGLVALAGLALVAAALDLASKAMALRLLPAEGLQLLPVLDLRLGFNRGVSFGFLAGDGILGRVSLIALPVAAIIFLAALVRGSESAIERVAYALISGGAFGNLADRLPDGLVTDFIQAHAAGWHFPTFNLADMAITMGVGLMVFSLIRPARVLAAERSGPDAQALAPSLGGVAVGAGASRAPPTGLKPPGSVRRGDSRSQCRDQPPPQERAR